MVFEGFFGLTKLPNCWYSMRGIPLSDNMRRTWYVLRVDGSFRMEQSRIVLDPFMLIRSKYMMIVIDGDDDDSGGDWTITVMV